MNAGDDVSITTSFDLDDLCKIKSVVDFGLVDEGGVVESTVTIYIEEEHVSYEGSCEIVSVTNSGGLNTIRFQVTGDGAARARIWRYADGELDIVLDERAGNYEEGQVYEVTDSDYVVGESNEYYLSTGVRANLATSDPVSIQN